MAVKELIEPTGIEGLVVIHPRIFGDERGYFYESYNERLFKEAGLDYHWVQDNQARSVYGVMRGLHFQLAPFSQAKMVRVLEGEVLDVVVDLRKGSPTYGKSHSERLSFENKKQLLIPKGFAHGYVVLTETAEFFYKTDDFYAKEQEGGIIYNDPELAIDWLLEEKDLIISEKDKKLPTFAELQHNFVY